MDTALSRSQVRTIDKLAEERYQIPALVLMENAGKNCAALIDREYGPRGCACVLCGAGNNGGDGFVIARHLSNQDWSVRIAIFGDRKRMSPETEQNLRICEAMNLQPLLLTGGDETAEPGSFINRTDVVVDALLGTGFEGKVREGMAKLIDALNRASKRAVVAVDVPSGLDCDTGLPSNATITADMTITFVGHKVGFDHPDAHLYLGRVEVAGIGAPKALIDHVSQSET